MELAKISNRTDKELLALANLQIQCIKYSMLDPQFLMTDHLPPELIPTAGMSYKDRLIQCRDIFNHLIDQPDGCQYPELLG